MSQSLVKGPETKKPLPRLRPDLVVSQQTQEDRTYFILKDPVSLQYLRLARHEKFIVNMLDGKRSLDDISKLLQKEFAEAEFDPERAPQEILQFLKQMTDKNFLLLPPASLISAAEEHRKDKWKQMFRTVRQNLFFFRVPLFDPDKFLTRFTPYLKFIWTRTFLLFSVALLLTAIIAVALNFDLLTTGNLKDYFNWHNLALLWIAFIGVKVIHEFGHGFTCKHYGGEVHQIGLLVLAFTPAMYCDTTDAWMMPKRTHKILVSSAGIYVELIIAALAAFVWLLTQEGLVHQLALILMFMCSFSTVVFNANPLLKYDGYYMLADAMDTPNLQNKSYAYMMQMLRTWLFGERTESANFSGMPMPQKHRSLFAVYSMIRYFYRWFVLFAIFIFIGRLLKPFGLEGVGKFFAVVSIFSSMIFPVAYSGFLFFRARSTKPDPEPLTRPVIIGVVLVVALILACWIPVPNNVTRNCVLKSQEGFVRANAPGFLRDVKVKDGDVVAKGQILGVLENRDLQTARFLLQRELEIADVRISEAFAVEDATLLQKARAERTQSEASLKKVNTDLNSLVLLAPAAGVVQGIHLTDFMGHWFERGQTFCQVSPTQPLRVLIPLDQSEARLVKLKNPVALRVYGNETETYEGTVSKPPVALLHRLNARELASHSGGDVPTQTDRDGQEKPSDALYEAELEIKNPIGDLRPGMTGRAKIECGSTTVGKMVLDAFHGLIVFDLQMWF